MSRYFLCHDKYQIDAPHLIDPHPAHPFDEIAADQLPAVLDRCFEQPVNFPAIASAVLPDDSIAIAVAPDTPCGMEVARALAEWFSGRGNRQIRIVVTQPGLPDDGDCQVHQPRDPQQAAYLLADRNGHPVHLNRTLFEADVVIPVSSCHGRGGGDSICPHFCDHATRQNLNRLSPDEFRAAARQINENLGIFWQVKLVTAPGNVLVSLLAGSSEAVIQQAERQGSEIWTVEPDQPAGFVVATIESRSCQNWDNVRRAILAADRLASDGAAILVCANLTRQPAAHWPAVDGRPASQKNELAEVFRHRHIYLASGLDQGSAEQAGFGHVQNSAEIQKLVDRHESTLLLRDAHQVGFSASPLPS